ncbi:MAG: S9 family peptidase, partial [Candidatus Zixiibacteriota bacterium]
CRKKGSLDAPEEVLLDVNELAEGRDFMRLGTYEISPDHNLLAFSTDTTGGERYTLQVKDLRTGEIHQDRVENVTGDMAWANDNRTFFYSVPDEAWRFYKLYRHELGTSPDQDELIYHEPDEKFEISIFRTRSDKYLMLDIGSATTDEVRYLDADSPAGGFRMIKEREEGVEYSVSHQGDRFLIVTNKGAINFKLMETSTSRPTERYWRELIPHREETKIDRVSAFRDFIVIFKRENGLRAITVWDLKADEKHDVSFPEPVYSVYSGENPEYDQTKLRFTYTSLATPNSVYDYDMTARERELLKQREVLGGYDPEIYESQRIMATASDGMQVPISMIYRKGLELNGRNPLWLNGYGSYGYSSDPYFSSNRVSLLDRGFIYAIAHVRGGGEMGRKWYDEGKLLKKKNTFTDFIACAEHLIAEKYTDSEHLVISGGSAGGLLVGAVLNMRPDLFEVCLAYVPWVDVVNTMLDASIPLTTVEYEEWGNPNEEEYFNYMLSYSPYDNVRAVAYPHILIRSSLNDTRVQYWEPAKWIAKLRAVSTGDKRLILKMAMGAGHGGVSGRYDRFRRTAFDYAFLLDCFGMAD